MKGYKVKVVGQYIARSGVLGKERIIKNYEMEANIPSMDRALSVVKNKLLGPVLSKKYEDYVRYRTFHIVQITPLDQASKIALRKVEVRYMDREALINYIHENALPVDHRLYPSLFKLREAVEFAKEDPDGYAKRLELRRADLEMDLELAAMNPEAFQDEQSVFETAGASISLGSSKQPGTVGTASDKPKNPVTKERLEKQTQNRLEGLKADMKRDNEIGETDEI